MTEEEAEEIFRKMLTIDWHNFMTACYELGYMKNRWSKYSNDGWQPDYPRVWRDFRLLQTHMEQLREAMHVKGQRV